MHCIFSFSFNNARVLYVFARKTFNLIDFDAVFFEELEKIFRSGCQEVARNRKSFCKKQCQTKQGLYFGTSIIFYLARALTKWGQINFESAFTYYFVESKVKTALQYTEVRFASFLSGGFITAIVVNPPESQLAKRTSVHCVFKWTLRRHFKPRPSATR